MEFEKLSSIFAILFLLDVLILAAIHSYLFKKNILIFFGMGQIATKNFIEITNIIGLYSFFIFTTLFGFVDFLKNEIPLIYFLTDFSYRVSGLVLMIFGFLLMLIAQIHLGKSWRVGIDEQTKDVLVTSGLYAFSRNPIFLALNMIFLSFFFAIPNYIFLVFAIVSLLSVHLQIKSEEKFLTQHYKEDYLKYCKTTGRYFTLGPFRA